MFLAQLTDKEKSAFLNIAQNLIGADGVLSDDEITMMEQYKAEMGLEASSEGISEDSKQSIEVFKCTTTMVKKQVVFELMALAYADKSFADAEYELLEKLGTALGLKPSFLTKCNECVQELLKVYEKIGGLVGE